MPLPDKEYFTFAEIAQRWGRSLADVEYYAKTEKLEVCVHLLPVDAESGTYDQIGPLPNFQERLERGCFPIVLEDLWTVLHRGEVKTGRLKPHEGDGYLTIAKDITVTRDELVVTRAELEKFEAAHGIAVAHTQPSAPSDDQSTSQEYRTGLPGRPSIAHLVDDEFCRRAKAGECEKTLTKEAKAIHEWVTENHPNAPHSTPKTIENHIRDDYRKFRNGPTK